MTTEEIIKRGTTEIIQVDMLIEKLKSSRKLKIKLGVDPTAPDLHLGHLVVLKKLKEFQDLGCEIIFLIGDFTSKIGDPSGKSKTRPMLTDDEIAVNTQTYIDQVGKILDIEKITIRRNSEWFDKMPLAEFIKLASKLTVASILERDDFQKRFQGGVDIGLHELTYPLLQAYDSVQIEADVELGGTDQKFNLLAGRELMKKMGLVPQEIITMPLLLGTDGIRKMSKSLGNYIGLNEKPNEIFGKVMSIPDEIILSYYQLLTDFTEQEIEKVTNELNNTDNPKPIKEKLAYLITASFYSDEEAQLAQDEFKRVFTDRENPSEIEEVAVEKKEIRVDDLLVELKLVLSKSEAKRLIEQGGLEIDRVRITDPYQTLSLIDGAILHVGKRKYLKIKFK